MKGPKLDFQYKLPKVLKFLLLLITLSSFANTCLGQYNVSNDSLIQLLEVEPDSQKVTILLTLAQRLLYKETSSSKAYAQQSSELAFKINDTIAAADAIYQEGITYAISGDTPSALAQFIKAYGLYKRQKFPEGMGKAQVGIGNIHQMNNELEEAIIHHKIGLSHYITTKDSVNVAYGLNNIGLSFKDNMQYDSAIYYFKKRLDLTRAIKAQSGIASSLNNLANTYKDKKEFKNAEKYLLEALAMRIEMGNPKYIGLVQGNLGEVYFEMGQMGKSAQYFEQCIANRKLAKDLRGVSLNSSRLAKTYREMGLYDRSINAAQTGREIAQQLGHLDYEMMALEQLKETLQKAGNYKEALVINEAYHSLQDTLLNKAKVKELAALETKFDVTLKEEKLAIQDTQIDLLEKKNHADQKAKWMLIATGLLLTTLLIVLYNRYQLKQKTTLELTQKNEAINQMNNEINVINKELEKKMLRAQMDPHFIFNSLNSIQHFITTNEKKLAIKYLSKFSKLIRKVLDNSINDRVSLNEELSLLEDYMELEELRLNHSFEFELNISKEVDVYNIEVPFLIIQPYVENAIKHGLKNKPSHGKLNIKIIDEGEFLKCTIEDNGIGRDAAKKFAENRVGHKSHGMNVTQKRLDLLNKSNTLKTKVSVEDLVDSRGVPMGTKVELVIPHELN